MIEMEDWEIDEIIAKADVAKKLNEGLIEENDDMVFQEFEFGAEKSSFVAVVKQKYLIGTLQRRVLPLLYEVYVSENGKLTSAEISEKLGISVTRIYHVMSRLTWNGLAVKRYNSYRLTRTGIKLVEEGRVLFRGEGEECSRYINSK